MRMRRINTPVAAEMIMNEMRVESGFMEAQAIEPIVFTLNGTNEKVKKVVMRVDPLAIHIPCWQRNADMARINAIAQDYDELMFENPKCIFNNGRLEVVEGQHRVIAMAKRRVEGFADATLINIEVLKCDDHKARELFLQQGIGRKNPTPADIWRAELMNNNPDYISVKEICDRNNFAIKYDDNQPENPVGILTTVGDYTGTVRGTKRDNAETLDKILKLLTRLGWCASEKKGATKTGVLRALSSLYSHTDESNHKIMEDALVNTLGGVENFEKEIITTHWGYYFDTMRNAINTYNSEPIVLEKYTIAA